MPDAPGADALTEARAKVEREIRDYACHDDTSGDKYRAALDALVAAAAQREREAPGRRGELSRRVAAELDRAYAKHGREPWGRHEFYAILLEEVEEVWDAIKRDLPQDEVEKELVQVAAMCFRYYETEDRYRQRGEAPR